MLDAATETDEAPAALAPDAHWTTADGTRSGRIFARALDLAVGHVRFEHLAQPDAPFQIDAQADACAWRVVYPPWWTTAQADAQSDAL